MGAEMAATEERTFHIIVRHAEEGGFWAEVVELPGCVSQGETKAELARNIMEAIEACLEANDESGHLEEDAPDVWKLPVFA